MDHQETYEMLYQAGFTASEIDRLEKLRRAYAENKRMDAYLYPSESVTIGLLFALKGGRFCAFESWLNKNYRACFPHLPERTRLQRLLRDCAEQAFDFLADPTFFTVVDTYGIELIHPRCKRRSKQQIERALDCQHQAGVVDQ
jgi:hypothetical protein